MEIRPTTVMDLKVYDFSLPEIQKVLRQDLPQEKQSDFRKNARQYLLENFNLAPEEHLLGFISLYNVEKYGADNEHYQSRAIELLQKPSNYGIVALNLIDDSSKGNKFTRALTEKLDKFEHKPAFIGKKIAKAEKEKQLETVRKTEIRAAKHLLDYLKFILPDANVLALGGPPPEYKEKIDRMGLGHLRNADWQTIRERELPYVEPFIWQFQSYFEELEKTKNKK